MDIHQCIDARAALTLGKDMTFRDYAQGAFRMRGIGNGQTIELFIIPEVMRLVEDQCARVGAPQAPIPTHSSPFPFGQDLLPLQPYSSSAGVGGQSPTKQLLVNVAAWLTVNAMKSENMQFRMLCQQSIDNVSRKRAYILLTTHFRELTQLAFSARAKEYASKQSPKNSASDIDGDLDLDDKTQNLFADDMDAIRSVVLAGTVGSSTTNKIVGIEFIQKSIDILTERLDFTVPNSIPMPVPLSDTLRNSIMRRQDYIKSDYDKAVVEKILMVLVNSEGLARKRFGEPTVADEAEDDQDANLQKEQVAEEE
jgi:hypothetical protein